MIETLESFEERGICCVTNKGPDLFCIVVGVPQQISGIFHAGLQHLLPKGSGHGEKNASIMDVRQVP